MEEVRELHRWLAKVERIRQTLTNDYTVVGSQVDDVAFCMLKIELRHVVGIAPFVSAYPEVIFRDATLVLVLQQTWVEPSFVDSSRGDVGTGRSGLSWRR
jgi:hypothetical protein